MTKLCGDFHSEIQVSRQHLNILNKGDELWQQPTSWETARGMKKTKEKKYPGTAAREKVLATERKFKQRPSPDRRIPLKWAVYHRINHDNLWSGIIAAYSLALLQRICNVSRSSQNNKYIHRHLWWCSFWEDYRFMWSKCNFLRLYFLDHFVECEYNTADLRFIQYVVNCIRLTFDSVWLRRSVCFSFPES